MNRETFNPNGLKKITKEELSLAVNIIADAFYDDPLLNWLVKNDSHKKKRIFFLIQSTMKFLLKYNEIYITEDYSGAIVWSPPENTNTSLIDIFRMIVIIFRVSGINNVFKKLLFFDMLEKNHPKERFYHLVYIGIKKSAQGKGFGTKLLKPFLDYCDSNNLPIYLENTNEKNIGFYKKNGFKIIKEINIYNNESKIWLMYRKS